MREERNAGKARSTLESVLLALVAALLTAGCGGPFLVFPGGALRGTVATEPVRDWSFVDDAFIDLELRPEDPYSIELNYTLREGRLYVDPAEGRRWLEMLRADSRARVRFGSTVYPVEARLVGKPGELEGFDPDRFIYELVWRDPSGGSASP